MKICWEPEDIKMGRKVRKPGSLETWVIGYDPSTRNNEGNIVIVSLSDGCVSNTNLTKNTAAELLNKYGQYPVELLDTDEDNYHSLI